MGAISEFTPRDALIYTICRIAHYSTQRRVGKQHLGTREERMVLAAGDAEMSEYARPRKGPTPT